MTHAKVVRPIPISRKKSTSIPPNDDGAVAAMT
jgi:hypothetical protein